MSNLTIRYLNGSINFSPNIDLERGLLEGLWNPPIQSETTTYSVKQKGSSSFVLVVCALSGACDWPLLPCAGDIAALFRPISLWIKCKYLTEVERRQQVISCFTG